MIIKIVLTRVAVNSYMAISQHLLATQAQGFKSLMCYGQAMVLTAAIQMDAVEFYYHSGVVSEYKCGFGTVRWSGIG